MKLVHPELEGQIFLDIQKPCNWIIESPELFSKYVNELFIQTTGEEGNFILSEDEKELAISKYTEIIINPFSINKNDKKILGKLYTKLNDLAFMEENYLLTQEIRGKLQNYLLQLEQSVPYILEMDMDIEMSAIFKAVGIKFEKTEGSLLENIHTYIKILTELVGIKLIIFVNINSYLNEKQIKQLKEMALYNEVFLMFIESSDKGCSREENRYIIDIDGCEIF